MVILQERKNVLVRKEKPSTQQAKRREAFRYTAYSKETSIPQHHSLQLLNAECVDSVFYVYLIKLTRACHKLGWTSKNNHSSTNSRKLER